VYGRSAEIKNLPSQNFLGSGGSFGVSDPMWANVLEEPVGWTLHKIPLAHVTYVLLH